MQKSTIGIGTRVRIVPQHWLRAYEEGSIIDYQLRFTHGWLVRFDRRYPGGGIDGDKLWLDESEFVDIIPSDNDRQS